jgi:hypothetical protein
LPRIDTGLLASSSTDLVLSKGYPLETYDVETPDGYLLRMHRIPQGK